MPGRGSLGAETRPGEREWERARASAYRLISAGALPAAPLVSAWNEDEPVILRGFLMAVRCGQNNRTGNE